MSQLPASLPRLLAEVGISRKSIYLWMANQYLDGEVDEERVLMPTYKAAMQYLGRIDEAVERIGRALENSARPS